MSHVQPHQLLHLDSYRESPPRQKNTNLGLTKQPSNKRPAENSYHNHNNSSHARHSNTSARHLDTEEDMSLGPYFDGRISREHLSPGAKNLFILKPSGYSGQLEHQRTFFNSNLDDSWHSSQNGSITPKGHKHHHHKYRHAIGSMKPKKALLATREEMNIVAAKTKRSDSNECESLHVSRTNFDDFTVQSIDTLGRGNYASYRRKSCECVWCGGCSKFEKAIQNYPGIPALIPHERNNRKIVVPGEKSPNNRSTKKKFEAAKTKIKIISKNVLGTPNKNPVPSRDSNPGTAGTANGTQDMTTPKATSKILQKLSSLGGISRRSSVAKSTKSIEIEQKEFLEAIQQEGSINTKGRLSTERALNKPGDHNSLHNIQELLGLEKILSTYEKSPTAASRPSREEKKRLLPYHKNKERHLHSEYGVQTNESFKNIMSTSREMKRNWSKLHVSPSNKQEEKVENLKEIEHKILKNPRLKLKKISKPQVTVNKNSTIKKVYCNPETITLSPRFHVAPNFFRLVSRNQASVPVNKMTTDPNMLSRASMTQVTHREMPSPSMEYYSLKREDNFKIKPTKRTKVKQIKNIEIPALPHLVGLKNSPLTAKSPKTQKILDSPKTRRLSKDALLLKNYQSTAGFNKKK